MRTIGLVAIAMALFVAGAAIADAGVLRGSWKGPWYIGMSSGTVTLHIAEDGSGGIALTNLDDFGSQAIPLAKQSFDGKLLTFTATGANGASLVMNLRLSEDGKQMRGNGKHAGFGARMELQRAD